MIGKLSIQSKLMLMLLSVCISSIMAIAIIVLLVTLISSLLSYYFAPTSDLELSGHKNVAVWTTKPYEPSIK